MLVHDSCFIKQYRLKEVETIERESSMTYCVKTIFFTNRLGECLVSKRAGLLETEVQNKAQYHYKLQS